MVLEERLEPGSRTGAFKRVAEQLEINPETLRQWVRWAEARGAGTQPQSGDEGFRIAELERENNELRRTNFILKHASAYFAAELERQQR